MGNPFEIGNPVQSHRSAAGGDCGRACRGARQQWHRTVTVLRCAPGRCAGILTGFCIGVVASLLGVAGGELLIPTLVLLFGVDIKLAGSLSLAVSLPTMLVGFARYSQDRSFGVLKSNLPFVLTMAAGSIAGTFIGGRMPIGDRRDQQGATFGAGR